MERACLLEDLEARHARHLVVEDHEVEGFFAQELDRGLAPIGALDRVAERLQHVDAEDDDRPGIVHNEDLLPRGAQFAWARAGVPIAPPLGWCPAWRLTS